MAILNFDNALLINFNNVSSVEKIIDPVPQRCVKDTSRGEGWMKDRVLDPEYYRELEERRIQIRVKECGSEPRLLDFDSEEELEKHWEIILQAIGA